MVELARRWSTIVADCAGLSRDADVPLTPDLYDWADIIMVMEPRQKKRLSSNFGPPPPDTRIVVLGVPDRYEFLDNDLIGILMPKLTHHFGPPDRSL